MTKKRPPSEPSTKTRRRDDEPLLEPIELRIIGGTLRGRKISYLGDPRTRPMKDRVREAVFNLVGPAIKGTHAVDLFAGTGALGFEALSRGSARATFFEKHFPTADAVRRTAAELGVADRCEVAGADTLVHVRRLLRDGPDIGRDRPWVVFCSPPYELFVERGDALRQLLGELMHAAPPHSIVVCESNRRFDPATLPEADAWRVREYPPAVVAVWNKSAPSAAD